jgi:hypothetical protein
METLILLLILASLIFLIIHLKKSVIDSCDKHENILIEGKKPKDKHNYYPLSCLMIEKLKETTELVNVIGLTRTTSIQSFLIHQTRDGIHEYSSKGTVEITTGENYKHNLSNYFGFMNFTTNNDGKDFHNINIRVSPKTYEFILDLLDKCKSSEGISFYIRGDWKRRNIQSYDEYLIGWLEQIKVVERESYKNQFKIEDIK